MPEYTYTALDPDTRKPQKGKVRAIDQKQAELYLGERGLEIMGIAEIKESKNVEDMIARHRPVPLGSLVFFTRQLSTMNNAGMPLLKSLNGLAETEGNPKLKDALDSISSDVKSGKSLQDGMRKYPDIFDVRYVAMVEAGDASGNLSSSLQELASELEKRASMEKAVKSATTYPKVIGGFAFFVLSGLMIFMIPKFAQIFEETAATTCPADKVCSSDLPGLTQFVKNLSLLVYPEFNASFLWVGSVFLRFAAAIVVFMIIKKIIKAILKRPGPRERFDAFKLRAPMKLGPLMQKIAVARFARTYSSLISSGITAVDALPIVADTAGNKIISDAIKQAQIDILEGKQLHVPLEQSGAFPPIVIQMIKSGEETGQVDEMMAYIADYYEEEVDSAISSLSSIIEPLMLVAVGSLIGLALISIYLPMFKMYDNIG